MPLYVFPDSTMYFSIFRPDILNRFHSAMQDKKDSPFSETTCHFFPVLYYTVQVPTIKSFNLTVYSAQCNIYGSTFVDFKTGLPLTCCLVSTISRHSSTAFLDCTYISTRFLMRNNVQGASLFSLTVVTLNRAAMLFLPTRVDTVNIQIIQMQIQI